jgi:hypothetical protein
LGLVNALRDKLLVFATGPDLLALFAENNRRPGILAQRQDSFRRDTGVTKHGQGNKAIVV